MMLAAVGGCDSAAKRATSTTKKPIMPIDDAGELEYQFPCLDPLTGDAGAPTFNAVFHELFCRSGCANIYCHGSRGTNAALTFETPALAYGDLVGVPAGDDGVCAQSGLLRVEPNAPDRSLLFLKLSGQPPCGGPMPPPPEGYPAATAEQLAQVRAWIEDGAPQN